MKVKLDLKNLKIKVIQILVKFYLCKLIIFLENSLQILDMPLKMLKK